MPLYKDTWQDKLGRLTPIPGIHYININALLDDLQPALKQDE